MDADDFKTLKAEICDLRVELCWTKRALEVIATIASRRSPEFRQELETYLDAAATLPFSMTPDESEQHAALAALDEKHRSEFFLHLAQLVRAQKD